ncbi:signal-induced proliferation-associated 1-like protein 2 isoform X1 [Haliotis rubra]|uniref:signal-induced proliferation-associated 1-like protein 2 isoform X1 n=1 Tax=Haliotis rubra TaxID=36100 RepID=UPI001EE5D71C|nr:signal-induced proliferation-associated 1-like protein 2 isoform X1 [Haliotis rubra]XP_046575704.1 signal-induced proliferation-associated 1-like protein 2 isoform X1 [Haliotis rubra]XP_046575705.1 signal-induced proliferation-associated 1-like protein 2 isoform X1 [Haliotis rubra]XP_046575706.1 signal-induced proliferation-associated 1-like protein 2 isoform X1 [Haliotis rubra]
MATKNQPFQNKPDLDTVRERAMQAVEYYQQQVAPTYSGKSVSRSGGYSGSHSNIDRKDYLEGYAHSSTEDALNSGIEPASSNNFYRAQMKAGIIDMRSSMSERIGTGRSRARTFHGPHGHTNRTRTQNFSIDKTKTPSKPSVPPKPVEKSSSSRRTSRGLYRSNSNLEMDTVEVVEEGLPPAAIHREYGSTSSLDQLGTSTENFFAMLRGYQNENPDQRSPAPPQLQEVLRGKADAKGRFLNGAAMMDKESEEISDSPKGKNKSKFKDRKARAKSITDGNPGILKKVFGGKPDADVTGKTDYSFPDDGRAEERYRRKALAHFDCQSVGVNLSDIKNKNHSGIMKNTATGASAASFNRNSYAGDKDDPDIIAGTDEGDGKSNELVLSCPFFRNEIGGEEERIVSLTKLTAQKRVQGASSSNSSNHIHSAMSWYRHPACCGVAVLDSSPAPSGHVLPPLISHKGHVIEYVDYGAYYYRHFFFSYDHQNFFGNDDNLGPVAISIRREKVDADERTNHLGKPDYGFYQYRIICRTSELTTIRGSVIEDAIPSSSRLSSSRGVPVKEVLEFALPEVQLSSLKQAVPGMKTAEQLLKVDEQGISNTYKVGIKYCKSGQASEEDMYNNEHSSPAFEEFLKLIGKKVKLKGFDKYRGGLDCKTDSTGTHSYYTTFENCEIMFHVSTMLPFTPNNRQQLLRERHIGNDIVTIVFQEPGSLPFTPKTVRSQFQHVFIIVQVLSPNTENVQYRVSVTRSKDVPPFGPPIPENASFTKSAEFVDFLLAKVINAENAAHKSDKFRVMASRTRQEYLKDLAANYSSANSLDSGSKLSKFALGSGRKKERSKQKVVPDLFAKGGIVWNVQIEDYSNASQVECLLAMAADTVVLMEEGSKYIIFTIPCGTVIGWTLQGSSLRLYFNQGEFVLLRPISGEREEMDEIISRLSAITQGSETLEINLRRNGLGQLGFHIQSEGIVTEVEEHGFAWSGGLRKGSRLVEICKVATATLNHEQIVDLLRTSQPVKVVVVPPLEDGSPRGFLTLNSHFHYSSMGALNALILSERVHTQKETKYNSQRSSLTLPLQKKSRGGGDMKTPSPRSIVASQHSSDYELNNRYPTHAYTDSTLSSGRGSDDGRLSHYSQPQQDVYEPYRTRGGNPDGHVSSGDELHSRSGSHDSSDYSLSGSGNKQWNHRGSVQGQAATQVGRRGEPSSGMEAVSQNSYLTSTESIYSQTSGSSNYGTQRRNYHQMDYSYTGLPLTGNIALELLKQTQNTKYLLRQGNEQQQDQLPTNSATNLSQISEGSSYSSGSSQIHPGHKSHSDNRLNNLNKDEPIVPKRKDSLQAHSKASKFSQHKKNQLDVSPLSSNNSSPRSSNKNLSGMSSEESLATRLRPGVMNHLRSARTTPSNFQEELMRLIDPDISEKDLATYTVKGPSQRRTKRIQRTMSDESLHSTKGTISARDVNHIGSDVIFTTAVPAHVAATQQDELSKEQRLSPRAVLTSKSRPRSRTAGEVRGHKVPLPESTAGLDWSNLVDVATKAIECDLPDGSGMDVQNEPQSRVSRDLSEDVPRPRPPTPQDSVLGATSSNMSSWRSAGLSPQQVVEELEMKVVQLQQDLDKESREKSALETEVQQLRSDNVRLQEESQTAAAQLRRFTEWFFNTIDRQ